MAERARDKERIAEVKSCAEAVKAAGDAKENRLVEELPDACGDLSQPTDTDEEEEAEAAPSPAKEEAAAIEEIGARLGKCLEAVEEAGDDGDPAACDRLRRGAAALAQ